MLHASAVHGAALLSAAAQRARLPHMSRLVSPKKTSVSPAASETGRSSSFTSFSTCAAMCACARVRACTHIRMHTCLFCTQVNLVAALFEELRRFENRHDGHVFLGLRTRARMRGEYFESL
jgi:hypothetical protein